MRCLFFACLVTDRPVFTLFIGGSFVNDDMLPGAAVRSRYGTRKVRRDGWARSDRALNAHSRHARRYRERTSKSMLLILLSDRLFTSIRCYGCHRLRWRGTSWA